jgi:hypothetical protein
MITNKGGIKRRAWTAEELRYIKRFYGRWTAAQIACEIGRPVADVRAAICLLGLAGSPLTLHRRNCNK